MTTIPSGSQEGSSTGVNVENNITGQSSQTVYGSTVVEGRVISLNGVDGILSITSNTLNVTASGSSIDVETNILNSSATQTTISGTTAGSIVASMPFQGDSYKKVILWLDGYENDTTTAQTYTFPVAFTNTPFTSSNSSSIPNVTVSKTDVSLAPDTATAYTGWIVIEGY